VKDKSEYRSKDEILLSDSIYSTSLISVHNKLHFIVIPSVVEELQLHKISDFDRSGEIY